MTNNRFTLYDFIVDVVPGLTAIGLSIFLLPAHPIVLELASYGNFASGLFALVGGYISGRIFHGIGGWWVIESCARLFVAKIPGTRASDRNLTFERRIQSVLENGDVGSLEYAITDSVARGFEREFFLPRERLTRPIPSRWKLGSSGRIHDLVYARYAADSLLYGRGNLSWKYTLLATFFRNSWIVLGMFGTLFAVRPFIAGNDFFASMGFRSWAMVADLSFSFILVFSSVICFFLWFAFERRQSRAMINELYFDIPALLQTDEAEQ